MAGVNINLDVKDATIQRVLQKLKRFPDEGVREAFSDLGPHLMASALRRAKAQRSPDNIPWAKLSPRYQARKAKTRGGLGLLVFDRHLLGDRFSYQITGRTLRIGTASVYGATHQFGDTKRNIPARPFIGFSAQDKVDIVDILKEHITRLALGG